MVRIGDCKGGQKMDMRDSVSGTLRNTNSKWVEGLVLLAIIIIVMLFSSKVEARYTIIQDEKVSTWSGTIDNLK